jgi:hypothetical protein
MAADGQPTENLQSTGWELPHSQRRLRQRHPHPLPRMCSKIRLVSAWLTAGSAVR